MTAFMTSVTNRIDAKGRVSIPAKFRANLAAEGAGTIACVPSLAEPCLEGYTAAGIEAFAQRIASADLTLEVREAFQRAVLSNVHELSLDSEGRIVLSEELRAAANISGAVTFVGVGDHFEIWEPGAYAEKIAAARALAAQHRHLVQARPVPPASGVGS